MPSYPVAILTAGLIGIAYSLVVPGRPRQWAKWAITVVVAIVAFARLYMGVDHPADIIQGVVLTVAFMLIAFRWFAPNEAFPVTYRRGKTAHLDVTGARGDAIRQAINHQLGLTVKEVKPIGLEASGGSTPLRLQIAGDPDRYVFAKLYAKSHVRADRWYKLGRTILYGTLEDEASFQTVRRFVQYEDYTLRLMQDMDLPVPRPTASSRSHPSASTSSSWSSSTAPSRSAIPRSTTGSSTRACGSSASCGTPAWPTATSSRETSWCATAGSCWSTRSSCRYGPHRGGRPWIWAT